MDKLLSSLRLLGLPNAPRPCPQDGPCSENAQVLYYFHPEFPLDLTTAFPCKEYLKRRGWWTRIVVLHT